MGICETKPTFASAIDQNHLLGMIKEERKHYDKKVEGHTLDAVTDAVNGKLSGKNIGELKKEINLNYIQPVEVLMSFLEGVNLVQEKLAEKQYSQFKELGVILDEYFPLGFNKDKKLIRETRQKIYDWFKKY